MNKYSAYPWAEKGRICKCYFDHGEELVEILEVEWEIESICKCKELKTGEMYYILTRYLHPVLSYEEIMEYGDKIIEEYWIDSEGNNCVLYLIKFDIYYFKIKKKGAETYMEEIKKI